MNDKETINTGRLTPEEKTVKAPKTNKLKNTIRALIIGALMLGPSAAKAQNNMMDPKNPIGYTNPTSINNPIGYTHPTSPINPNNILKRGQQKKEKEKDAYFQDFVNITNIARENIDPNILGISETETKTIEKDFDSFFAEILNESDNKIEDIVGNMQEIGKKHNLNEKQLASILIHYLKNINEREKYSEVIDLIQKEYSQEEIQQKTENIFKYKGNLSTEELCKKEFAKVFENSNNTINKIILLVVITLLAARGIYIRFFQKED